MRINELLVENNQIDEISLGGVVGGAAKGIGAVVGGARGAWDKAKQGYAAGRAAVGGDAVPRDKQSGTSSNTGTATPGPAGTTAPSAGQQQVVTTLKPTRTNAAPATNTSSTPQTTTVPAPTAAPTTPAAAGPSAAKPAAAPAPLKAPPAVAGNLDGIKKIYSTLDPAEREQLKKDLDVIDDRDRLASGTNESIGFSRYLGMAI